MIRGFCFASVLFFAVSACSGGGPAPNLVMVGNSCEEGELDLVKCGQAVGGTPAVIQCSSVAGGYYWSLVEQCVGGECQNSQCVAGGDGDSTTIFPPRKDVLDVPDTSTGVELPPVDEDEKSQTDGATLCEPGQIACEDEYTTKACNWFGDGWDYETCPEGEACDHGVCLETICTPGDVEGLCLGPTSYSQCNPGGTAWEPAYCTAPLTCFEGECVGWQCEPGSKMCKGMTAIQECILDPADQQWKWQVVETCEGSICNDGSCQSACEVNLKENTYLGCDYWAVDLDNVEGGEFQPVAVVVSVPSEEASDAEITFTDRSSNPPKQLTPAELDVEDMLVPPGGLKVFMLPTGKDVDGSVHTSKSFQITSTAPVTVHQFNPLNGSMVFTNDASLLLPSNSGGQEYYVMAWPMRTQEYMLRGFAAVVATQPGTTKTEVWPTSPVLGGSNVPAMAPNPPAPHIFYMAQGDVLNLETDGTQGSDLTGTRIVTDRKVTVFGGHECANIPLGTDFCDHVEQQLFPVQAWGTHYIGDAFKPRNTAQKDTWRILSGADNVQVTLNPAVAGPFSLNKGQWQEFHTGTSFDVKASGPILLGHFMQGSNYSGFEASCDNSTGIGDPAFTLGIPVEQYLEEYIVLTPADAYKQDFINIMFKIGSETAVTVDGAPLPQLTAASPAVPVGNTQWAVAQVAVEDGVHTIKSPENPIGVTAYGYDCDVSYAYPGGLSLKTIQ